MKKSQWKHIFAVLCSLLLVAILVGCGGANSTPASSAPADAPSESHADPAAAEDSSIDGRGDTVPDEDSSIEGRGDMVPDDALPAGHALLVLEEFYFLDGDIDGDNLYFWDDGTFDTYFADSDEEYTGEYTIDGDTITIMLADQIGTLEIIDEFTLEIGDDQFIRD